MDLKAVADEIETSQLSRSAVHKYMGNNVKSPGLIKGQHYIVKCWSIKSTPNSDNPYWIGQFLGAGQSVDNIQSTTPRAKELKENERYFFKRVNGTSVASSNYNGALILNKDPDQRITFYALSSEPSQDALPLPTPTRTKTERPEKPAKPAKIVQLPPPGKIVVRSRKERSSNFDKITANHFSELLKDMLNQKPTYRLYYVAVFVEKQQAVSFAKLFKQGVCVSGSDGVHALGNDRYITQVPQEENAESGFFNKAKAAGAVEMYNHNVIVPKNTINVTHKEQIEVD